MVAERCRDRDGLIDLLVAVMLKGMASLQWWIDATIVHPSLFSIGGTGRAKGVAEV